MNVQPESGRFSIEHTPSGIRVSVPARKNIFMLLFFSLWLTGWGFGEFSVMKQLLSQKSSGADAFLFVWLVGWTLGGIWAIGSVLWQLFGREIIGVESGALLHRVEILGFGRTKSFDGLFINHCRVVDFSSNLMTQQRAYSMPLFIGEGVGPFAFDYGAKSIRLGASFEEAEARLVMPELLGRLPSKSKK